MNNILKDGMNDVRADQQVNWSNVGVRTEQLKNEFEV